MGIGSFALKSCRVLQVCLPGMVLACCGKSSEPSDSGSAGGVAGATASAGQGGESGRTDSTGVGPSGGRSSGGAAQGGGTSGAAGAGGNSTGGALSAGGSDAGGAVGGPSGKITITSLYWTPESPLGVSSISARFSNSVLDSECTRQTFGDCYLETCPQTEMQGSEPDAGVLTVTSIGAARGSVQQSIIPDTSRGTYQAWTQTGPVFMPNDVLQIQANGGEVPPFQDTVSFPTELVVASPAPLAASERLSVLEVAPDSDFELSWDGPVADDVILVIQSDVTVQPTLVCHVPSTKRRFAVPRAALAGVPRDNWGEFYVVREHPLKAGKFDVLIRLATLLVDTDKSHRVRFHVP
ncbi:MAG TPA: hypothetical protein VFQ61_17725 [Polyangiaceae bacterium]|nr:hypothetical protein [Polyangiaceae bacterium]